MPPTFFRDHYYSQSAGRICRCRICRNINVSYNHCDRRRWNHLVSLHAYKDYYFAHNNLQGWRGRGRGRGRANPARGNPNHRAIPGHYVRGRGGWYPHGSLGARINRGRGRRR